MFPNCYVTISGFIVISPIFDKKFRSLTKNLAFDKKNYELSQDDEPSIDIDEEILDAFYEGAALADTSPESALVMCQEFLGQGLI